MSIHDEKEYNRFKSLMYLDEQGTQDDPGLYWRTKFLWNIDLTELLDNKATVASVMNMTENKLQKKPGVEKDL